MRQILCFGDSNTWGYIPGTGERYPWGVRWTSILQDSLQGEKIHIIEDGVVGRTSVFDDPNRPYRNGAKVLPLSLEVHAGIDMVVLMLGTNDCKSAYQANVKRIEAGIETLIRQVKAADPDIKILLVSPIELGSHVWEEEFDPEFDEISVQKSRKLKKAYRSLAQAYGLEFLAASDYALPSDVDREHMTEKGHRKLAEALQKKIISMMEYERYHKAI